MFLATLFLLAQALNGIEAGQPRIPTSGLIAVLEFRSLLSGDDRDRVPPGFLTDLVRSLALEQASRFQVMTRENLLVLVESQGRKLTDCEGECEVETGRRLGAEVVISGELLRFGANLKLNLRVHETRNGRLVSGVQATGADAEKLEESVRALSPKLFEVLRLASESAAADPRSTHKRTGLTFVRVESGTFFPGCSARDRDCKRPSGTPPVEVAAFWLGRTEATAAAYATCVADGVCAAESLGRDDESCTQSASQPDHPANCLKWQEAATFCRWLGGRLPTAVELEYASKRSEDRVYPWGDEVPPGFLLGVGAGLQPVGYPSMGASKEGFLGLAGSLWEWTSAGPDKSTREARGGSWYGGIANLKAGARLVVKSETWSAALGVRCVR